MVTAREAGACVVCTEPYAAGEELGLVAEGWAHVDCWEHVMLDRFGARWIGE